MSDTVTTIPPEKMLANWCQMVWGCPPDTKMPVSAEQVVALHKLVDGVRQLLKFTELPEPGTAEEAEKAAADMEAIEAHLRTWLGAFEDTLRREALPKRPEIWRPS